MEGDKKDAYLKTGTKKYSSVSLNTLMDYEQHSNVTKDKNKTTVDRHFVICLFVCLFLFLFLLVGF